VSSSSLGALVAGHPLFVPYTYLAAATLGAGFSWNALRPLARGGRLSVSAFFAGWITGELPLHHLAWQVATTAVFIWTGALDAWPGWVGLALALASWAALVDLYLRAQQARVLCEEALGETLGKDYRSHLSPSLHLRLAPPVGDTGLDGGSLTELLFPFVIRHRDVERTRGVSYGPHGRRNQLDVYRRKDRPTGCPVLVQVHGGAWILGSKEQQGLPLVHHLAAQGWVCVSINYRLSPRSTYPDQIVDVKQALAWVKEHIAEYGGDPAFVAITGGSAGGHLASLAALTANDPELQPGFAGADTRVQACVPFYGAYDFTNRSGEGRDDLVRLLERLIIKKSFKEARDVFDRASPMSRVNADAPPFLVIHGANDTLLPVAEARHFVALLRGVSKAEVAYIELPLAQHAFEVFTSVRTAHVIRAVARFLSFVYAEHQARQGVRVEAEVPALAAPAPSVSVAAAEAALPEAAVETA
jgi:acetyl esterase/lipase